MVTPCQCRRLGVHTMKQAFVRKQRNLAQSSIIPLELQLGGYTFLDLQETMVSVHAAGPAPD